MVTIHPRIESLQPYVAGIRPKPGQRAIKLNQNESPYPASPKVVDALRSMTPELLRSYPEAGCDRVRSALSVFCSVPESMVACGNGSSELITLVYQTFLQEGDTVALPYPTFGLYATVAEIAGVRVCHVQTDDDYQLDPEKLAERGQQPQAIIVANPNAPTGLHIDAERIEKLLRRYRGLLVVDEAYIDFAPEATSVMTLVAQYDNLLVLRTFSKAYSLSGVRFGYAVGHPRLIEAMERGRGTFSVNAVAQLTAEAALSDPDYIKVTSAKIIRTRDRFSESLQALGWRVWPSSTNFVWTEPAAAIGLSAGEIYSKLLDEGIYVRHFDAPRMSDKLRISIGTDGDMEEVLKVLTRL